MAFSLGIRSKAAGYQLAAFDTVGSTNTVAMEAARRGETEPQWFVTTMQSAGRGRRQRPWSAPRGNLAASVLEVVDVSPSVAATLGFAAGLATEAALTQVSLEAQMRLGGGNPLQFKLKWPNDILASGQKLVGISVDAEVISGGRLAIVVGIGTNVVAYPEGTPYPATSLAALGVHVGAEELFGVLSDSWARFRGIWDDGRGFAEIRELWLERAAGLGEPISVKSGETSTSGTFDTIDETGCLIIRAADGKRLPITAGDVFFGPTASAGATR